MAREERVAGSIEPRPRGERLEFFYPCGPHRVLLT